MSSQAFIQSGINQAVYLRAPELEVVAKPQLWKDYLENGKVFVRGNFSSYKLEKPYVWSQSPIADPTWQLYFHSLYFLGTVHYGLTDSTLTPALKLDTVSILKERIFSYFDFLDLPDTALSPHVWDDHAAAYRASYLSLAYSNMLASVLSAAESERYVGVMQKHAMALIANIDSGKWHLSNHTIFHIEGLIDIALNFFDGTEQGDAYIKKCQQTFLAYLAASVSMAEGTSKEHACFYHAFLMERVRNHYDFLRVNNIDITLDVVSLLKKMNRFLWLIMPKPGLVPPIGDTKYQMQVNEKYYKVFMHAPYVDNETAFLMGQKKERGELSYVSQFREDGYFVLRDMDALDTGLLSIFLAKKTVGPHGHMDGGSFVSYLGGVPLFIDSGGPYKYGDPLRYKYFQLQHAHSTLVFGKQRTYQNSVEQVVVGPAYGILVSKAFMGDGIWWFRIFGQIASTLILCVDIPLSAHEGMPIQARYHLAPEARLVALTADTFLMRIGGKALELCFHDTALPGGGIASGSFTAEEFSVEDQGRALVTRADGKYEEGNMICRLLAPGRPSVMLASIVPGLGIQVTRNVDCVSIAVPPVGSAFPGGCFHIRWAWEQHEPVCNVDFQE